jgi:NADPH2:quinone reductase
VGVNYPDVLIIEDQYQFKPPGPSRPAASCPAWSRRSDQAAEAGSVGDRVIA